MAAEENPSRSATWAMNLHAWFEVEDAGHHYADLLRYIEFGRAKNAALGELDS
jgi:hypothetical protein